MQSRVDYGIGTGHSWLWYSRRFISGMQLTLDWSRAQLALVFAESYKRDAVDSGIGAGHSWLWYSRRVISGMQLTPEWEQGTVGSGILGEL